MKKLIIALLTIVASISSVSAQSGDIHSRLGVRASLDVNCPVNKHGNDWNNGAGFSVCGVYNIAIGKKFYIEPGVTLFYNTFAMPVNDGKDSYSYRNSGLRIPLTLGYRIRLTDLFSMAVFTGAQFNYGFSMKEKDPYGKSINLYTETYLDTDYTYKEGRFRRIDGQILLGVRGYYTQKYFVEVVGGYGLGNLLRGLSGSRNPLRRNIVSVGLGYMF